MSTRRNKRSSHSLKEDGNDVSNPSKKAKLDNENTNTNTNNNNNNNNNAKNTDDNDNKNTETNDDDNVNSPFTLPDLPWAMDAFEKKGISKDTIDFHYNKHHRLYVLKLNMIAKDDRSIVGKSLEQIIQNQQGAIFNLACQIWNHTLYWNCMSPETTKFEGTQIYSDLEKRFGSIKNFETEFKLRATNHFGSGYLWLVCDINNKNQLEIVDGHDAFNPLKDNMLPVLTIDIWEHAYSLDYGSDRKAYVDAFWNIINWDFVNKNYENQMQSKK